MPDIFERASRAKLRFDTPKGSLTVEDLWDLPLTGATGRANLNSIAIGLNRRLQETAVSFVPTAGSVSDGRDQLGLDVVRHVIEVRVAEAAERTTAAEKAQTKARIRELIAQKRDAALADKSIEDLEALVASL